MLARVALSRGLVARTQVLAPLRHTTLVRGFANAREDLLKQLQQEIKHETQELAEQEKSSRKYESPFKLVSENKSGEVILGHESDGYKISVKFDAKNLTFSYPDEEDPVSSLPIEIEITPSGMDVGILVSGSVEEAVSEEGEETEEGAEGIPYFTPDTVQIGKPGSIPEDAFSPNLDELDAELQDCFAEWLADFQIDQDLFQMVMDHADKKENQIYLDWLGDMKRVVERKKQ